MRKIEKLMWAAINNGKAWALDNTSVRPIDDVNVAVYLHGNHIADVNRRTWFVRANVRTFHRWPTRTTKSRLNALGVNYKEL